MLSVEKDLFKPQISFVFEMRSHRQKEVKLFVSEEMMGLGLICCDLRVCALASSCFTEAKEEMLFCETVHIWTVLCGSAVHLHMNGKCSWSIRNWEDIYSKGHFSMNHKFEIKQLVSMKVWIIFCLFLYLPRSLVAGILSRFSKDNYATNVAGRKLTQFSISPYLCRNNYENNSKLYNESLKMQCV